MALYGRAVAQLTRHVIAPALHPATARQGTGVLLARGDGGHPAPQPDYIHGRMALYGRAVAQLTS